ncbi:hypothetical protein PENSPDRAFT_671487 [Peniophora sp. CONT]|nr:hypothetical protein PENSPDRAFT_671487 [Peniophora sp. CONT]
MDGYSHNNSLLWLVSTIALWLLPLLLTNCAIIALVSSFFQVSTTAAASVLLAQAALVLVLIAGGSSSTGAPNIDLTAPGFVSPSERAANNPAQQVPAGVISFLLPHELTLVLHSAADFEDRLPRSPHTPLFSDEAPNILIHEDPSSVEFCDELHTIAPQLLHSAIYDSRTLSSQFVQRHNSSACSIVFAPNLCALLWALEFVEPYLAEGFEGVVQTHQHLVAHEVRNRLQHIALHESLCWPDGSEVLLPQDPALFLSRRWLNDSTVNARLN